MSKHSGKFESWIRTTFVDLNTALEELYFTSSDRSNVERIGTKLKNQLESEGNQLVINLAKEGNTDEGFDAAFRVLGNLGLFLAALRRHELTNPERESVSPYADATSLGLHISSSIGVAPRFATSHLTTHNLAVDGKFKSFTRLEDELFFIEYNARGILGYKRVAESLRHLVPLGISHPIATMLLKNAASDLQDIIVQNKTLFDGLDQDRFFYCVRPYYKPYRVGSKVYRGANAGDFAGINIIDLLLGVCCGNDPYYSELMVEKFLFMMPDDQVQLRDCLRRKSFLDQFLSVDRSMVNAPWFQRNAQAFLEVCDLHGKAAAQHHNMLVDRFIKKPSAGLSSKNLKQLTASGPPLEALLESLVRIRDLRRAATSSAFETRYEDFQRLRNLITVAA